MWKYNEKILDKVEKSDMILLDGTLDLKFEAIGLFDTRAAWTHPSVTIETWELIYVLAGDVCMYEGDTRYTVRPGEMLLLEPGIEHGGFATNEGHTSFYWLHFFTNDISAWKIPKHEALKSGEERVFRELMHMWQVQKRLTELTLAKFFLESGMVRECRGKAIHEVREYIRIHAREAVRVEDVAAVFGYSADHLSRLYKSEFGCDLKEGITRQRLLYAESLLLNTDASVKEIAALSGFEDGNAFVKFFKYHRHLTPTQYRNRFFHVHMNVE